MARIHRTVQKSLNDLDEHVGAVTHLEPDILECEVQRTLSIVVVQSPSHVQLFVIPTGL